MVYRNKQHINNILIFTIMKRITLIAVALIATFTMSFGQSFTTNNSTFSTSYGQFITTNSIGSFNDVFGTGTNEFITTVSGYTRSNGTYVEPYVRTQRNDTNHDNFSTVGNFNIFTGTVGTRARDYSPEAYNYGSGRTIYTGSRGGQYYINGNGNKVYVPKRW